MIEEMLKRFEEDYKYKPRTLTEYHFIMNKYFEVLSLGDEIEKEKLLKDYFTDKTRDFATDIRRFFAEYVKNLSYNTRTKYRSMIKQVFIEHEIEFPDKFWKGLRKYGSGKGCVVEEVTPSVAMLNKLLSHGDTRAKAFFLLLASTGARVKEALQIEFNDIDWKLRMVTIREPKGDSKKRITFFTTESAKHLKMWLQEREEWIQKNKLRTYSKEFDLERVFPFSYAAANAMFRDMRRKAGLDETSPNTKVNRYKLHIHSLRKFFITQMYMAGVSKPHIEYMSGHEGYLDASYHRPPPEELKQIYEKGSKRLFVIEIPSDDGSKREEIEELRKEISVLQERYGELMLKVDKEIIPKLP